MIFWRRLLTVLMLITQRGGNVFGLKNLIAIYVPHAKNIFIIINNNNFVNY